ncbi:MAG: F0F1 ATP synthase subunit delta [Mariprofundaceae bacterium]
MSATSIARRYARALFELNEEGLAIDKQLASAAAVAALPEVQAVLSQPQIPAATKATIIDKAAGGLGKEMNRLLAMLCERGKATLLPEIYSVFAAMQRQAGSEIEAEVISATSLNAKTQAGIAAALSKSAGCKVSIKTSEDKDIMGGLVLRIGDRQLDYSLRTRLEGLKRAMVS